MKHQALFSSKAKSNTIKCRLLQFLFGAIRVNIDGAYKFFRLKSGPSILNWWVFFLLWFHCGFSGRVPIFVSSKLCLILCFLW